MCGPRRTENGACIGPFTIVKLQMLPRAGLDWCVEMQKYPLCSEHDAGCPEAIEDKYREVCNKQKVMNFAINPQPSAS